jgi:hypothetical protein
MFGAVSMHYCGAPPNSSQDFTAHGAPGSGPGLPYRGSLAVPRLLAGSVASWWIMLKEPLVPLMRKEVFVVHAHATRVDARSGDRTSSGYGPLEYDRPQELPSNSQGRDTKQR